MDNTQLVNLSQQLASYRSMEVIANNLANVSTPAFKRQQAEFQNYVETLPPAEGQTEPQTLTFVQDAGVSRDMSEGQFVRTGAPFDLAVNGNGFFVVQTANGDRYTRNGHFELNAQGVLVTQDGNAVQGDGGEITVTPDDGDVHIAEDGTVSGAHGQLGKVRLVDFADDSKLQNEGGTLYSTDQTPTAVAKPDIAQGTIESSNVQPVVEISQLLQVMRAYQATAKLTQAQEDLMRQTIDKLGTVPN
jgi:flagellar basal-body rod protein FlgF